jgi:hypothetical protein
MLRTTLAAHLLAVACCSISVAATGVIDGESNSEGGGAQPESVERPRSSCVILPYAYYSPETKLAFGVGGIYSFRTGDAAKAIAPGSDSICSIDAIPGDRPSSVRVAATYTQQNQMILAILPELYLDNERHYFAGFYGYYRYPDRFWGIGGDTPDSAEEKYRSNDFESSTSVQMQIAPGLYLGPLYEYRYLSVDETEAQGQLQTGTVPGSQGGSASGLGVILRHDTRDHVYQPATGFYNQVSAVAFSKGLGSDYTFEVLSLDLRLYHRSVFRSHVVAIQTYDVFIFGEAPFQRLALLGGSYSMRGYYKGRYRDRNMITTQVEYRFPIAWRIGATTFVGAGEVLSSASDCSLERLKYCAGFGLRFLFDAQERINARLDFGFGGGNNAGIYAMVLESF